MDRAQIDFTASFAEVYDSIWCRWTSLLTVDGLLSASRSCRPGSVLAGLVAQ